MARKMYLIDPAHLAALLEAANERREQLDEDANSPLTPTVATNSHPYTADYYRERYDALGDAIANVETVAPLFTPAQVGSLRYHARRGVAEYYREAKGDDEIANREAAYGLIDMLPLA